MQPRPAGLCDALFRAAPLVHPEEHVLIGLPDTVWFPEDGLRALPDGCLSFLLFPVERPELFDAVVTDDEGHVREIQVKQLGAESELDVGRIQDARLGLPRAVRPLARARAAGRILRHAGERLAGAGRSARGIRAGEAYVDVGTLHGYREAIRLLSVRTAAPADRPSSLAFHSAPRAPL